ncbi:kinase-like protein [Schizopora paradoxa]|uniref:Kinase-like protein n=1 Tax=Schizopora paradoxa TaxID=27342 RepID=A0A0H2RVW3_9AGAM|nr:kinase-like protein [Schizopora paradoxa]
MKFLKPALALAAQNWTLSTLTEVVEGLPHHNLEGLIDCSPKPTSSSGGYSDIYTGSFKSEVLRDIGNPTLCLICRSHFEIESCPAGTVCPRCTSIWNEKLAVKKIRVHVRNRDHSKAVARELYVFSKLSHPNVLPFTGFIVLDCFPAIVTPWVEKGSLYDQIRDDTLDCSEGNIFKIANGIACGLAYLHRNDFLHCDLKSPNILLSPDNDPLLADFGLSRTIGEDVSVVISNSDASPATYRWSAPELFENNSLYSRATDVWAFGMVLYVCCYVS